MTKDFLTTYFETPKLFSTYVNMNEMRSNRKNQKPHKNEANEKKCKDADEPLCHKRGPDQTKKIIER